MSTLEPELQAAYEHCLNIANNHYENFPVASWLLGRNLRYPFSAVYAFARSADDFADEGDLTREQRLTYLENYTSELKRIEQNLSEKSNRPHISNNPVFIALADVIQNFKVPVQLFHDLLSAFKSDVTTTRYNTFTEILDYCRLSANPVGQILLYLNKNASDENLVYSDAICTGLQLINFYQDIAQDIAENDRLYLPLDEMNTFGVSVSDIRMNIDNDNTQALLALQLQRAKQLYYSGKPLCFNLSGRFAMEIHTIFAGGQVVLDKLEENISAIYLRPRLTKKDKIKILWKALINALTNK